MHNINSPRVGRAIASPFAGMNFPLNGHVVNVGPAMTTFTAFAVTVDGHYVGYRRTMADALTLATVATTRSVVVR